MVLFFFVALFLYAEIGETTQVAWETRGAPELCIKHSQPRSFLIPGVNYFHQFGV